MDILRVEDFSFSYPDGGRETLCHVDMAIREGTFNVLCGKSGCGKSTLMRQMKSVLAPYGKKSGRICYQGVPLEDVDHRTQSAEIGYVLQNPENQIVTDKVWHELAFGLESLGYDQATIRLRVAEMASYFGIHQWFYRDVSDLSGGQKQLLNLAAIMAMHPKLLLLDEPTSQLDPIAASDFLETVKKINRDIGTTVLLTEHRLQDVIPWADQVFVMDAGEMAVQGTPRTIGEKLREKGHGMFLSMPVPMQIYAGMADVKAAEDGWPLTVSEGRRWITGLLGGVPAGSLKAPLKLSKEKVKRPAKEDLAIEMKPGTTGELEGFRVWQTVLDSSGNTFVEPDMHYEIVSGDSVKLEAAGGPGREYQTITAVKEGTTVIKVTYDDMEVEEWAVGAASTARYYMPPIDKENTGIVIVNVGGSDEGITSGIDATDYDTQYFAKETILPGVGTVSGNDHVQYSFTPSAESGIKSVRVRAPYKDDTMAWDASDAWQELTPEEGVYTAQLYDGRNIVEITDQQGHILYKAVNAKAATVTVENATAPGEPLAVGDEAHVSFAGLELPVYKMCAIYNPGFPSTIWVEYTLNGGTKVESTHGQYNIHHPIQNTISFTVQKEGENKMEGGRIHATHMGDQLNSHLNIPKDGRKPNFNADNVAGKLYYSALPTITFNVGESGPWHQVVALIDKIDPDDYLGCIRAIMDARAAYDQLSAEVQAKVTNVEKLTTAESDPAVQRTIQVVRKIDALPDSASLAYEGAIRDADQAYRGLYSDAERAGADKATGSRLTGLVEALERLIAAEARKQRIEAVSAVIAALPDESVVTGEETVIAAINSAKRAYDALSQDEQAEVAGSDKLAGLVRILPDLNAANNVIKAIAQIGEVTPEDYQEKEAVVEQTASLYQNLTERQQGYVSNRDMLEKAQYDIDYYGAEQAVRPVMEQLAALQEALARMQESGKPAGEAWTQWKGQIAEAQRAYDALTDSQKESLTDYAGVLSDARAYTLQAEADEVAALIGALPDPAEVGAYDETQTQGQLTEEQLTAIAAAQNALQALTDEEKELLPEGTQERLLALAEKARTYPAYQGIYLQPYIDEVTGAAQDYQENGVTRGDLEAVEALLNRYDSYTPEEQAVLDQSLAQMLGGLREEVQRIRGEIAATDALNGQIQALPSTVDIQGWQGILGEIQAIETAYEALSADAKGYVTDRTRLDSLKAQIQVFQAQVEQFEAGGPALTAAADTPTQVTLIWGAYADATSYRVWRKEGRGGWKELAQTGALSYTDRDVKGSTTYTYTIQALSAKWGQTVESARDEAGTTVTTPFGSVPKLTGAKAVRYDRVTLTWTRCADATGYEVYRAEAARGEYKKVKTLKGSQTLTWTDTRLRTGRTYYYKIRAYRTVNGTTQRAGYSNMKAAKPSLSAAVIRKASVKGRKATIGWKKVNGASGYVIYRSDKKNGRYRAIKTVKKGAAGQYTDKKLKKGKTYHYRVRAYRTVDGKRVYGGYSKKVKTAKIR